MPTINEATGQRSRAYSVWWNMKRRCDNPTSKSFEDYGARGIGYVPRWASFLAFLEDMGEPPEGLTLERENNEASYGPHNCKWATRAAQALNKRNNVRVEHEGRTLTLSEWARETGIQRVTLLKRLQRGVPIELALTTRGYLDVKRAGTALLNLA